MKNKYSNKNKNIYSTSDLFIHSMKGMRIPFTSLELNSNSELINKYTDDLFLNPIINNTYSTFENNISPDYINNSIIYDNDEFNWLFYFQVYETVGVSFC